MLPASERTSKNTEMSKMEQNSGESRSGEAMSIFGQSIDVRRPVRSRKRATPKRMQNFTPAVESPAKPSVERLHQRRAVAERERARAESELSRASSMATELERQIEQANSMERSHSRSELQGTRAAGSSRRKKGPVDVEAPGADRAQEDQSNSLYIEVMQELDRVKRELRKLQREVKAAKAERDAETPTPRVSRRLDSVEREADDENEGRGIAEPAEPGGSRKDTQSTWTRGNKGVWRKDTSRASDTAEERFATASSSDVGLEPEDELAMVPATDETATCHAENGESALTITHHEEHDDHSPLQAGAEAELTSARTELGSIREEGIRLTSSVERTRMETARVTEEIDRLAEQEKRASAQVQQLSARLRRATSKLDAATAADERAEAALADLSAALRRLGEQTEAAEKERTLTELESRCVTEDAEAVAAEVAAAEQRIREAVKELEAARAAEAAAAEKLRAVVDGAMQQAHVTSSQRSSGEDVEVTRLEYEYLTGRGEVVRAVAEKKVAAAEAWVEALRAGEKEVVMRAEAIEREIGETIASDADDFAGQREPPRGGLQRTQTRRRAEQTSRKTGTPSSSMARKPSPGLFRGKR